MIKGVSKLLFLSLFAMASCAQQDDIISGEDPSGNGTAELAPVKMVISRAAADEFQKAGITEITVYTYHMLRKGTELYDEQTVAVGNGEFNYEFPLGETFQTIVTANVASVTGKETLETLTLNFDPLGGKEVWASRVIRFSSDKSVTELDIALDRLVARVNFVPAETATDLALVDQFDALNITFTNVAASYMPASATPVLSDIVVSTDASSNFRKTFYTFDTTTSQANSALNIEYMKAGVKVNQSASMLDTGITYEASSDYAVTVPITAVDFLLNPWETAARSASAPALEVVKTSL